MKAKGGGDDCIIFLLYNGEGGLNVITCKERHATELGQWLKSGKTRKTTDADSPPTIINTASSRLHVHARY